MRQEIVSKLDIHSYIGRFVELKQRSSSQYLGLCPFHNEKTPSFSVSTDKKFFHCFGCKASGDVVKFVMLFENISNDEAIRKLSFECGIKLDNRKPDKFELNKQYIEVNTLFTQLCSQLLYDPSYYHGLEYIRSRGIKDDLIHQYKVGYLPINKSELVLTQLTKNFSQETILRSGVFRLGINNRIYSPFVNRIVFPIFDIHNRNVGFGSRIINNEKDKAKYLNSSDSDFFHKSEILYGLEHLNHRTSKNVFVVEGYMDVISLANHGITNAVGVLGANLTPMQLKHLWKFTDKPTILLDGDSAGRFAMERIARMSLKLIEPCKSVSFLEISLCKDPDEFITKYGPDEFFKMFERNKSSLADYIYRTQSDGLSADNPDEVVVLRQRIAKICNEIADDALRNAYKAYFNKVFYSRKSFKSDNNKRQLSHNNLYSSEVTVLSSTISQKNYSDVEEKICDIIASQKSLLLDQSILDEFMNCKFISKKAENKRMELTKSICDNHVPHDNTLYDAKKNLNGLLISLRIKNVQDEILELQNEQNVSAAVEVKLLQLKQYEIQLKTKLSSILI